MLESLFAGALEDARRRLDIESLAETEAKALAKPPAVDALQALTPRDAIHVLAEVKRASPSRGSMAEIADPALLAETYATAGASAISVLTEERKFLGSLDDLRAVRARVSVPLLRKDFISTEHQILEARAAGADIVLLIVAGLDQPTIKRLKHFTEQLGMTAFVETHSADEVARALEIETKLLGINARDLSTFETDRSLFGRLAADLPSDVIKVAESAVRTVEDVRAYRADGADVVLVGEALVTGNPIELLSAFTSVA